MGYINGRPFKNKTVFHSGTMITTKVIKELYKRYRRPASSREELGMELLLEQVGRCHGLSVDNDGANEILTINSVSAASPFHSIPIGHVCAVVPFDEWVAIVLPSSIIFLCRENDDVRINLKKAGLLPPLNPCVPPWLRH